MKPFPPFTASWLAALAAAAAACLPAAASAQDGPGPSPRGGKPGIDLFPAPPTVGVTAVDLSYFGPAPTNPSLVGPNQLLRSGKIDSVKGNITLPLYKGYLAGTNQPVWYILTDTSDQGQADFLGINFSAKLKYTGPGSRTANFNSQGDLVFDQGTVDFTPQRIVVPGPSSRPYPPASAQPGSVGDASYSPLVIVQNAGGIMYNAPVIAFGVDDSEINFPNGNPDYSKVHDAVLALDPKQRTVTLQLVNGFSFGRPLWYISLDASDPAVAAVEANTYAPGLKRLVTGHDDSFSSPVERIFIAINGPTGVSNPQRQGLYAALTDGHRPNNMFGGIPNIAPDYSPMWNAQFFMWTPKAIKKGYRSQLREEFQLLDLVQDGILTGPDGQPFGDSGVIINCPPAIRLN